MDSELVSIITDLAGTVGMWSIFAWLYITERKSHNETRKLWNEDLREIAGLRHALERSPPTLSTVHDLESE